MIYTSYQIADIIGVNVSTIKRWTDSGKLSCHQTIGGHRKFHLNDVANFLKNHNKKNDNINLSYLIGNNQKLIDAVNNINYKYLISYCFRNLINGNNQKFLSLTNSLILKGYPIYLIFDNLIIPILKKIGDEWNKDKLSITEEHLASEIIRKFLSHINFNHYPQNTRYNAFCFTMINDKHDLPLHMGEAVLNQNKNIRTYNLGSNLPINDFIKLSDKIEPDIIFISIIYIEDLKILNKQIKLLADKYKNIEVDIYLKGQGTEKINNKKLKKNIVCSYENFNSDISTKYNN